MPHPARLSHRSPRLIQAALVLLFSLSCMWSVAQPADQAQFDKGEKVFKQNCASCHKPDKKMTGPALKGATERWDGKGDIHAWVHNSQAYLKTGNEYANKLFEENNKTVMTPQAISDEEIDAVLYYADNYAPPVAETPPPPPGGAAPEETPAWPWFLVLGLLFVVVWMSLNGVRKGLTNAVREQKGLEPAPDLNVWQSFKAWAWNNKVFASVLGLLISTVLLVMLWNWAFRIGVYGGDTVEHYRPEQPIAFNHTLHAGKAADKNLQINCQYCHSGAEKSKHAGIPSPNVCMNCHKAVAEGRTPEGTKEIAKIYAAVGWDPDKQQFTGEEHPIHWIKVHNLPDHVFFSHAQHVAVGKLECQECHGPIDSKMTVAEQWAPLTMGWCIDCHNQKEPKMAGNGYYDEIMARLKASDKLGHRDLKQFLEDEKITVRELGGWECAKCHY
ncbi:MAG: c-type cytochrome [Flavobacteriales bacterium]|nr:c-type cytochrome [Flavobacteriales bacterium]